MNFKRETIGNVIELITNGVNCKQNKESIGVKISRIETIASGKINYQKTGFSKLNEIDKKKYKLVKGDILFSHINSPIHVGKAALYNGEEDLYHGVNLLKLRVKRHISPYYFKYFLDKIFQSGYWKKTSKQSVNQASVNQTDIKKITFFYPSLAEQQSIVVKLDAAFAEIDKTINITQNKFKSTQIIFSKYLKNIFETKHAGYVSSTIGKTCTIKSGTTVKSNIERTAGKIPYLKVADMNLRGNEKEITTSSRFLDIADVGKNSIIEPGSTIFPKRGGAIATNKKRIVTTPICIDLNIMSVLPKKNIILPKLLYYYFINLDLKKLGSGSSIPQVNKYDIEPLFISFPNKIEDQDKTVDRINKLYAETNMLKNIYKKKVESLKNLKNSILSEFLNESKTKKIA